MGHVLELWGYGGKSRCSSSQNSWPVGRNRHVQDFSTMCQTRRWLIETNTVKSFLSSFLLRIMLECFPVWRGREIHTRLERKCAWHSFPSGSREVVKEGGQYALCDSRSVFPDSLRPRIATAPSTRSKVLLWSFTGGDLGKVTYLHWDCFLVYARKWRNLPYACPERCIDTEQYCKVYDDIENVKHVSLNFQRTLFYAKACN